MKLSDTTLDVLKNFAAINGNLVVQEGNVIRTMAEAKNIMAKVEVEESFDGKFGIYDLPEFLSVYNMFSGPELDFSSDMKSVSMSEGRSSVKYYFSDPDILTSPSKDIKMPAADVSFTLTQADLASIRKASSALGASDLVIRKDDDNVVGVVTDIKNSTANSFTVELEGVSCDLDGPFDFVFAISNFKLMPGDYNVEITSKLISKFTNQANGAEYFIALEKSSKVGA